MPDIDLNPSRVREQFPALQQRNAQGKPFVYFDGPGGTQVPQKVINAMTGYLIERNSNTHGQFLTSQKTDETINEARVAVADLLNAVSPDQVAFGANMTTLTFHLSRSFGRVVQPGDEIIVTRLDHDANISPWLALEERGAVIRWLDFQPEDCTLNLEALAKLMTPRTRLLAMGYASNAVGTINDVKRAGKMAHEAGAQIYVDAVHFAPHGPIDVQDLDCDYLACSAYKFFGPHVGVLYGKRALLEKLPPYKVRPQESLPPNKFETGTLNHEGLAGTVAAVEYLAEIGRNSRHRQDADLGSFTGRRRDLKAAMKSIQEYEQSLSKELLAELRSVRGLTIYGITSEAQLSRRTPTVAVRLAGISPEQLARRLGEQGIFVWDGNFYAVEVTTRLGVEEQGGVVRIGLVHYNTTEEINRLIEALKAITR